MKRSSSPENDDGPVQKRFTDEKRVLEIWRHLNKRVDTSGTVIWSGTVKIPDSQKIEFDCSIKVPPRDEGIKSLFPPKQLTIHSIPVSAAKSLHPYQIQFRRLILRTDENTDMMSYSAFSQAIRLIGSDMRGCAVLKNTASALHLLRVFSFSSEPEDFIVGDIQTYQANDAVLGILRSHGLLPCVNPEHGLAKQNAMLKEELQNKDKMLIEQQKLNQEQVKMHKKKISEKEEELVRLHQEVEEQKKMAEKKQEELATSQNERDMMEKAISEKDEEIMVKDITMMKNDVALTRKDREMLSLQQKYFKLQNVKEKYEALKKEKTELEEELKCRVQMLHEEQKLHQEQKELVEKKKGEIVSLQGDMEERINLVEEQKMKLTEMEKKMEEMNTQIMENDNALNVKDTKIMTLQQNQHKYRVLEKEKTKLEEELQCKVKMLDEEQKLHKEKKKMVEKKEKDIVYLQGEMEEKIKLVEEQKTKLTEMEKKIEEKNIQIMEKDNALNVKDTKIMTLQQNQHKVEELLGRVEGAVRTARHFNAGVEGLQEINKPSNSGEDIKKILMPKTSRLELENEVTWKQAALDEIKTMMEEDGKCSICQGLFIKSTTLNCSHSFCDLCIQKLLKNDWRCPICRKDIEHFSPCTALDKFIEGIVDKLGKEVKQRREEALKDREREVQKEKQPHSNPQNSSQSDDDASSVPSSYSPYSPYSPSSPSSPLQQLSVNEPLQLQVYRPSPPESFGRY